MARKPGFWSLFLAVLVLQFSAGVEAQTFSVLFNFGPLNDPMTPSFDGVIAQGRDGTLYSTSPNVNSSANGTLFEITTSGALTVPYYFIDGNMPESGVSLGTDGNLYATTVQSVTDSGELYRISPTGIFEVAHSFTGGDDGGAPKAPPIEGTDENYYGTTNIGGMYGFGTVYKLSRGGAFSTIYSFVDNAHGMDPWAPLVQGTDGNLYGTTFEGGSTDHGVFYRITTNGKYTALYDFSTLGGPIGALVEGQDGNYYGTASNGGSNSMGAVFKITPLGKITVLHSFLGGPNDGSIPNAGLVLANDGNFYGVTEEGGNSTNCQSGCGTIFRMTPSGDVKILYNFDLTTGYQPNVTLTQHTNGIFYGDTDIGGTSTECGQGCGVFFSLDNGLKPFVRLVFLAAKVGSQVQMLGQGFTGTSSVSFGGTAATFSIVSDTYLTATLPSGAKTGFVEVTTPGGVLTSNRSFRVTPQILSFSPTSGAVGTSVTIKGAGLIQTSKVTFGGVAATTFTVNSDSKVTATVPTGAQTGRIGITTPGGTSTSAVSFTVTSE